MNAAPREPFDREEAAVARAYAALPTGEPSADLDARILARARGAVVAQRRARPWFLGAGLGTAAAAVMAAGLAWQLGWLQGTPGATGPAAQRERAAARASRDEVQRVEVEVIRRERAAEAAPQATAVPAAPPAPPAPPARAAPRAVAPPPPADAAKPLAPPPVLAEPQPFPAEQAAIAIEEEADVAAPAVAAGAGRDDMEAKQDAGKGLSTTTATGARLGRAASLPHWTADDGLPPVAWLARIRERVHAGDRQSAEHSLRRFVQVHPRLDVPAELRRLLVE